MSTADVPRGWKTWAAQHCREIIARNTDGILLPPDETAFVWSVLARHPDVAAKIGCGVSGFTTGTTGGRHFVIIRADGTRTDFSWKQALSPASHRQLALKAMRAAVTRQTLDYRDSREPLYCDFNPAHPGPFHVDHADPGFIVLADLYASAQGGYDGVPLRPHADGDVTTELRADHAAAWAGYHQAYARLRILCQPCNCNGQAGS
jgi:hypothetical protein